MFNEAADWVLLNDGTGTSRTPGSGWAARMTTDATSTWPTWTETTISTPRGL